MPAQWLGIREGLRANIQCGRIARVRAAAHEVGRAHHRRKTGAARCLGGGQGGGELRDGDTGIARLAHMLGQRVVMTGKGNGALARRSQYCFPIDRSMGALQ